MHDFSAGCKSAVHVCVPLLVQAQVADASRQQLATQRSCCSSVAVLDGGFLGWVTAPIGLPFGPMPGTCMHAKSQALGAWGSVVGTVLVVVGTPGALTGRSMGSMSLWVGTLWVLTDSRMQGGCVGAGVHDIRHAAGEWHLALHCRHVCIRRSMLLAGGRCAAQACHICVALFGLLSLARSRIVVAQGRMYHYQHIRCCKLLAARCAERAHGRV